MATIQIESVDQPLHGNGEAARRTAAKRHKQRRSFLQWWTILPPPYKIFLILICLSVVLVGYLYIQKLVNTSKLNGLNANNQTIKFIPNPEIPAPPSASALHQFKNAAVCSDSVICSKIGSDILENKGGNIIDSAIATLFCNGITTAQSMGIGGGFIMNLYVHNDRKAYTMSAKEVAPLAATKDMFKTNESYINGPLSIGVPGEVKGYWELHKKYGSISWKDIIEPSIKICDEGFLMSTHMYDSVQSQTQPLHGSLKNIFYNNETGLPYKAGEHIRLSRELCDTYRKLATNGGDDFYNGALAKLIAEDLKDIGSIITEEDLKAYTTRFGESLHVPLNDSLLYITPPPSGGILVGYIMNILRGYNFTSKSIETDEDRILTYHRITEAFKFAFGHRTKLTDPNFADSTELVEKLLSTQFADETRLKINDKHTSNDPSNYGAEFDILNNRGTSHVSIIAPNGDAISVTSSINLYFGTGVAGKRTGIIFNTGMNDFAVPNLNNYFELPPSSGNYIEPGKRAMSSMSPSILTTKTGDVKMVIGASGGTKIPTSVSMVMARSLWFEQNIKEAVDAPRIHHQLQPMILEYEYGNTQQIITGLENLGHHTKRYTVRGSIICAIAKNSTGIYANADFRKAGDVVGL